MASDGSIIIDTKVDQSGLNSGLTATEKQSQAATDKIKKQWENFGQTMNKIGTDMTKFVTLPIVGLGVASLKFASDLNETTNKVEVAFGDQAKAVEAWSQTTLEKIGMADQTAMDSAATYGDMATSMGLPTKAAADMSMGLTELAGDLSSFKNIDIKQSQNALTSIFTGETESLKQLGIVMTQQNLQQFAMSQGTQTNIQDMTQAQLVTLRYQYILAMTTNAQGDFARTSGGAANQTRMMGEEAKQAAESFGKLLLPAATDVLKSINKLIQGFIDLPDSQKKTIITILEIAAAIGPTIKAINLLVQASKTSQAIFKAFTADGMIGGLVKAAAAHKAAQVATESDSTSTAANTTTKAANAEAQVAETEAANMAAEAETAKAEATGVAGAAAAEAAIQNGAAAVSEAATGTAAGAATPAVAGFGMALSAALGPIAVIGGALALLIPLLGALSPAEDAVAAETAKLNNDIKNFDEQTQQLSDDLKKEVDDANGSAAAAIQLVDQIENLAKVTNKTNIQKAQEKALVDQLNKSMPGLNAQYDKQTDSLNLSAEAMKDIIAAKKQEIIYNAYADKWTKAVQEQAEIEDKKAEATTNAEAAEKKMADAVKAYTDAETKATDQMKASSDQTGMLVGSQDACSASLQALAIAAENATGDYNNAQAAVGGLTTQWNANQALQDDLNAKMQTTNEKLGDLQVQADAAGMSFNSLSADEQAACTAMGITADQLTTMTQTDMDAIVKKYQDAQQEMNNTLSETTNVFEKIKVSGTQSYNDLLSNLKSNDKTVKEWVDNLGVLAKAGLDAGLIKQLYDAGPEAAGTVANLVKMTKQKGFEDKVSGLNAAFEQGTQTSIDSMNLLLGLPSTQNVGAKAVDGIATNVTNDNSLKTAASQQVTDSKNAMDNQVKASNFNSVGTAMIQGMINGMGSLHDTLILKAQSLAKDAVQAMKDAIKSSSPSKVTFSLGQYFTQGFALGIEDQSDRASKAASSVSASTIQSTTRAINDSLNRGISQLQASMSYANTVNSGNTYAPSYSFSSPQALSTRDVLIQMQFEKQQARLLGFAK